MVQQFLRVTRRGRLAVAVALFFITVTSAGLSSLSSPRLATADSCDPVNIIRCGLDTRSLQSNINSFQASYQHGSNDGHNDLKTVYRWAGATDASVAGMNTGNTKMGTLSKDGTISVNGRTVGSEAAVAARFGGGRPGFHKIAGSDNAYWRLTTTSFAQNSAPVIVHFTSSGTADFAVMTDCGNAVKFPPKPPKPQPKPALVCVNLTASEIGDSRQFKFQAKANAKDTTITKYVFDYGDGKSNSVRTANQSASSTHTYGQGGSTFKARVTVFSSNFPDGKSGSDCVFTVRTPKPTPPKPSLVCVGLTQTGSGLTYTFHATAAAKNTTITSYVFDFGDGKSTTVSSRANKVSAKHTFAELNKQYVITVKVNSKDIKNVTSTSCKLTLKMPKPDECKPGVPKGDVRCHECKPGVPDTSEECTVPLTPTTPTELSHSGSATAATFSIVGAAVVIGTAGHRLLMRRKYGL
jgi:hypothetical protein